MVLPKWAPRFRSRIIVRFRRRGRAEIFIGFARDSTTANIILRRPRNVEVSRLNKLNLKKNIRASVDSQTGDRCLNRIISFDGQLNCYHLSRLPDRRASLFTLDPYSTCFSDSNYSQFVESFSFEERFFLAPCI